MIRPTVGGSVRRDEEHVVAEPEELSAIGYDEGGLSEVLGLTGIGQQAGAHSGRRSERTVGSPVCPAFCASHRSLKRLSQEDQAGLASAGKSHRWVNRDCRFAHAAARLTPIGTFIGSDRFPPDLCWPSCASRPSPGPREGSTRPQFVGGDVDELPRPSS